MATVSYNTLFFSDKPIFAIRTQLTSSCWSVGLAVVLTRKQNMFPESADCCLKLRRRERKHSCIIWEKAFNNHKSGKRIILLASFSTFLVVEQYTIPNPLIPYAKVVLIPNQNYALHQYWKEELFDGMHVHFQKNLVPKPGYESDWSERTKRTNRRALRNETHVWEPLLRLEMLITQ